MLEFRHTPPTPRQAVEVPLRARPRTIDESARYTARLKPRYCLQHCVLEALLGPLPNAFHSGAILGDLAKRQRHCLLLAQ
jgi:hypothetical protein